ncbi:MAG: protein translocase subunit SecF [Candidatus Yonathbacteria bacterium CG10_big_fil_rev_8_21_14_0_10_43_136]|uniref:Protein-export membrane protein SecF n=2 Tax=Parcubacteria group TaxID=1794811 RepID=A0A2M7Q504_9BACT|nr:MAG: protein-export membrane protein SecF [Candidatus Nomurabacteria bacterium CG2_30_43_9]PIQ36126.1 MAG: protein translocase subunit SecF [Candidatus Yonathbacteria bacterium CG17_big_fil_post_rev_8_21_14_2_50_43_9]PIR40463.1 MAG: protein translocase subunit SecF [Candidatus Yonathbacteria bacterium CG10_big_fil_rev_8_21_14_0_10_43_136]PIX56999.1 MAG: protein translocase subunit SecF [Candidatus Yonathbacteria bacterium CG_4_10_14_3_um_filter_43_12]PIY58150.1 MAG: protein translocase subun
MFIVTYRKIFFTISIIAIAISFYAMATKGFNAGIDFKGGSIIEVSYLPVGASAQVGDKQRPDIETLTKALNETGFEGSRIQMAGENDVIVKTRALSEEDRQKLTSTIAFSGFTMEEKKFSSIGPTIGAELRTKAWYAIALVILGIVLFIAYAFRHVSEPIPSWKYGMITTATLLHDIIVPAGVFVWLGKEVDSLFVIALLAIMGLSVHDTIVVFDRIRENLKLKISNDFATTVGTSLRQTFTRSINTSVTTMLVLGTLYFFGPTSTKDFSLILWLGIAVGTYSSVFIASPLLVLMEKRQAR